MHGCFCQKEMNKLAYEHSTLSSADSLKLKKISTLSPSNKNYTINEYDLKYISPSFSQTQFLHDKYSSTLISQYPNIIESCYIWRKNQTLSVTLLHLVNKATVNKTTLLFSHGSNATLGTIYGFLYDISTQLKCDVISYDYSKNLTQDVMNEDIDAIFDFIIYQQIPFTSVFLMGESYGATPCLHIAENNSKIGGLILISPCSLKLTKPYKFDQNINISELFQENISNISCPVFVAHSKADTKVKYNYSVELGKCFKTIQQWFPKKSDHFQFYDVNRRKFLQKIKEFIAYAEECFSKKNKSKGNKMESMSIKSTAETINSNYSLLNEKLINETEKKIPRKVTRTQYDNSIINEDEEENNEKMEMQYIEDAYKRKKHPRKVKFL